MKPKTPTRTLRLPPCGVPARPERATLPGGNPLSRAVAAAVPALLTALVACTSPPDASRNRETLSDQTQRSADRQFVSEPFKDQARLGVLRQRALYDAHFVPGSDRLNSLGRKDVAVLADALRSSGGSISIRRGSLSEQLYAARVAQVRSALVAAGIEPGRIAIDEGLPGGSGTPTEEALLIRADIRAAPMAPISDAVVPPGGNPPPSGATP